MSMDQSRYVATHLRSQKSITLGARLPPHLWTHPKVGLRKVEPEMC